MRTHGPDRRTAAGHLPQHRICNLHLVVAVLPPRYRYGLTVRHEAPPSSSLERRTKEHPTGTEAHLKLSTRMSEHVPVVQRRRRWLGLELGLELGLGLGSGARFKIVWFPLPAGKHGRGLDGDRGRFHLLGCVRGGCGDVSGPRPGQARAGQGRSSRCAHSDSVPKVAAGAAALREAYVNE